MPVCLSVCLCNGPTTMCFSDVDDGEDDDGSNKDHRDVFTIITVAVVTVGMIIATFVIFRCISKHVMAKTQRDRTRRRPRSRSSTQSSHNSTSFPVTIGSNQPPSAPPGVFTISSRTDISFMSDTELNSTSTTRGPSMMRPPSYQSLFSTGITNNGFSDIEIPVATTGRDKLPRYSEAMTQPPPYSGSRATMTSLMPQNGQRRNSLSPVQNPEPDLRDLIWSPPPRYADI